MKYIRNGVQYNSADNAIPPVPKYKSPPPRGKKRTIAITHQDADDEMFEREETPERANLLPVKRISKGSKHSRDDVTNYQFYKNTVSSSYKFGRPGAPEAISPSNLSMYSRDEEAFAEKF